MSSYRFMACNSTPSRSSPRAAIGCSPTGWATAAPRQTKTSCGNSRTRWPTPCRPLRRERQRNRGILVDGHACLWALGHHSVGPLAAVLHVGRPDQLTCPAVRVAQIRLDVGPEPATHVGHDELVALRHLDLDQGVRSNGIACNWQCAHYLAAGQGTVGTNGRRIHEAGRSQHLSGRVFGLALDVWDRTTSRTFPHHDGDRVRDCRRLIRRRDGGEHLVLLVWRRLRPLLRELAEPGLRELLHAAGVAEILAVHDLALLGTGGHVDRD